MKNILFLFAIIVLSGCANIAMLPDDVSDVSFDSPEGKTGWSKYEHVEFFPNYNTEQVFAAAKVGLGDAGFALRKADITKGIAIGEHGMTLHDWNVIAGVYFKAIERGTKVKVIVEGSKDIGFSGDVTSGGWSGEILKGIRDYLNSTYHPKLRIDRSDIK